MAHNFSRQLMICLQSRLSALFVFMSAYGSNLHGRPLPWGLWDASRVWLIQTELASTNKHVRRLSEAGLSSPNTSSARPTRPRLCLTCDSQRVARQLYRSYLLSSALQTSSLSCTHRAAVTCRVDVKGRWPRASKGSLYGGEHAKENVY